MLSITEEGEENKLGKQDCYKQNSERRHKFFFQSKRQKKLNIQFCDNN